MQLIDLSSSDNLTYYLYLTYNLKNIIKVMILTQKKEKLTLHKSLLEFGDFALERGMGENGRYVKTEENERSSADKGHQRGSYDR